MHEIYNQLPCVHLCYKKIISMKYISTPQVFFPFSVSIFSIRLHTWLVGFEQFSSVDGYNMSKVMTYVTFYIIHQRSKGICISPLKIPYYSLRLNFLIDTGPFLDPFLDSYFCYYFLPFSLCTLLPFSATRILGFSLLFLPKFGLDSPF